MDILLAIVVIIVFVIMFNILLSFLKTPEERSKDRANRKEEQRESLARMEYGEINPQLVCPHCQNKGMIRTKAVKNKKGISGAKATGALLTGGVSLLATGLSRKEKNTQAHCENCESTWLF